MRPALAIVVKELRLFFADRRSVVVGIVTPILLATFFGFLFSGEGRRDAARIPVLVSDSDASGVSRAVVAGLGADPLLAVTPSTDAAARDAVRKGTAAAAVLLPKGFGDAAVRAFFGAVPAPEVALLVDPSRATEAGLVRGLLSEKVFREASREAFGGKGGGRRWPRACARSMPTPRRRLRNASR
jgi:ABC-2 type transport system permease protein